MRVSVIVSTCGNEPAFGLALESLLDQMRVPDEIVVADGGCRLETVRSIASRAAHAPVPIIHAWQDDDCPRSAASWNAAIAASTGDYLVFLDGDCVVDEHFVADHVSWARPDRFVAGSRVDSRQAHRQSIRAIGGRRGPLVAADFLDGLRAVGSSWLGRFASLGGGFTGANFAAWTSDVVRINGFNEAVRGDEAADLEFAVRLAGAGVRRHRMVHMGTAYHLGRPEGWRRGLRSDMVRLIGAAQSGPVRCRLGLDGRRQRTPPPAVQPARRAA